MVATLAGARLTVGRPLEPQLAEMLAPAGYRVTAGPVWINANHPVFQPVPQGWKLHVSARPGTLHHALERAIPVLVASRCSFKTVVSTAVLRKLNATGSAPGSVGKAMTIYPPSADVERIGEGLADALDGLAGPRIVSDRRLRRGTPVFYRYGPIVARFRATEDGYHEPVLTAPDGTMTSGVAGPSYVIPQWVRDPFRTTEPDRRKPDEADEPMAQGPARLLAGRYRLTSGIARTARGVICRARDEQTTRPVIIKQGCAFVGEDDDGTDTRGHLRNERRILEALAGVPGVPDLVDHFAMDDSEFLAIEDLGPVDLRRDVADHGRYLPDGAAPRSLRRLAGALLSVLDAVHARGVVVRDLAPKNVVIGPSGDVGLIDFEISRFGGAQRYGWTPGYSVAGQRRGVEGTVEDDYFSLGATLFYATTGMDPVCMDHDSGGNVAKTLDVLAAIHPAGEMTWIVDGLLSPDIRRRTQAVEAIRGERVPTPRGAAGADGRDPFEDEVRAHNLHAVLDGVVDHAVENLLGRVHRLLDAGDAPRATNVYLGSAGIGVELLHHLDRRGVSTVLGELARWTATAAELPEHPRGLYFGSMGVAVFLVSAGIALRQDAILQSGLGLLDRAVGGPVDSDPEDVTHGLAGLGTGYLILHRLTGAGRHLARAHECAERLVDGRCVPTGLASFPDQRRAGIQVRYGFGHGATGIADFLLSCGAATGDAHVTAAAHREYGRVLEGLGPLVDVVRAESARPMSISWCQGLAGVGASLLTATSAQVDEACVGAVRRVADACLLVAPRVPMVSQCCGLSGVGEFLIDLGALECAGGPEYSAGARTVAGYILTRSGGPVRRPEFPDHSLLTSSPDWASGSAGVLSFFRRLRDGSGSRLWTGAWDLPQQLRQDRDADVPMVGEEADR